LNYHLFHAFLKKHINLIIQEKNRFQYFI